MRRVRACEDFQAALAHLPETVGDRACGEIKFCVLQLLHAAQSLDAVAATRYWVRAQALRLQLTKQETSWVTLNCSADAGRKMARVEVMLREHFSLLVRCICFPSDYDAVVAAVSSLVTQCPIGDVTGMCVGWVVPKFLWLLVLLGDHDERIHQAALDWFAVHCARECDIAELTYMPIDDDVARRALALCPALTMQSLVLRHIVTDALLADATALGRFGNLAQLSLHQCSNVTAAGVAGAMAVLPTLTHLSIVDWYASRWCRLPLLYCSDGTRRAARELPARLCGRACQLVWKR